MVRDEFKPQDVASLLVACHRRCCVCHRYCGVKIEIDHIVPASDGGSGDFSNAIALCFDCHAEVHHYNPSHPKGRKFRPDELRAHKEQWLQICAEHPEAFAHAQPPPEAGSLERLYTELDYNLHVAKRGRVGAAFLTEQFRRAIVDGTFVWLADPAKQRIHAAYAAIMDAHATVEGMMQIGHHAQRSDIEGRAQARFREAVPLIQAAVEAIGETM